MSQSPRQRIGLALAALSALVLWWAPLPLDESAHRLAAIFAAIVILWVTEALPIPVTALLIAPSLTAAGITDGKTAFAPYADPLLFLFVGGFFIARAMQRHRLDRRMAGALLNLPFVQGRPRRMVLAFFGAAALLSMWISNTASAAILTPILLGTLPGKEEGESGTDPATAPLLGLAYACSVGGLGTLVGSPPNGITARLLAERLDGDFGFLQWAMVGLPAAVLLWCLVAWISLRRMGKVPASSGGSSIEKHPPDGVSDEDSPSRRGQWTTALALGSAIALWLGTGLWKASGSEQGIALARALPGGSIALLACIPLFLLRDEKGERVLPWKDAAQIDWGIILLFGGGISLGKQMFETGLARALAEGFVAFSGIEQLWTLTALVAVFTIFFTEACSNTASATMLVPLVIAISDELGVSPVPPAMAVGLAASCAFVLPIATGPNAIAFGTGRIPLRTMMRTGLGLNLLCVVAIVLLLRLLLPLYGWV